MLDDATTTVTVMTAGLWTTIQDLGRPGHRAEGVPGSGGLDPASLRLANLLVGNTEGAATLECTLVGPDLRFDQDAVVAVAGADFPGLPPVGPCMSRLARASRSDMPAPAAAGTWRLRCGGRSIGWA